eukprot:Skav206279  [mRNA]  locus=scaffold922:67572:74711:- [translate_table: standard]
MMSTEDRHDRHDDRRHDDRRHDDRRHDDRRHDDRDRYRDRDDDFRRKDDDRYHRDKRDWDETGPEILGDRDRDDDRSGHRHRDDRDDDRGRRDREDRYDDDRHRRDGDRDRDDDFHRDSGELAGAQIDLYGKPGSLKAADWMAPHICPHRPVTYFMAEVRCESTRFDIDCTSDGSVIVPHLKGLGALGEAFAGIGGWKFGLQFLKGEIKMSVEHDTETAQAFARTHGVNLLFMEEVWPLVKRQTLPSSNFVLVADMKDPRVWALAAMLGINGWAMSPPCPPWSSAGNALGLQTNDGVLLTTVLDLAGKCGVQYIMMENVPNIVQHSDFGQVKSAASQAGFALVVSQIDDVSPVVPCNRKRWMAIFMSSSCVPSATCVAQVAKLKWPRLIPGHMSPTYTLADADSLHVNVSHQELSELQPSESLCRMLEDPALLAPWLRRPGMTKDDVLKLRVVHGSCVFKAIMASYGTQDKLPIANLKKSGLHTFIMAGNDHPGQSGQYRLASPWELLAALGFASHAILPVSPFKAWRVVGNAITPCHAALTGLRLHCMLGKDSPFHPVVDQLPQLAKLLRDLSTKLSGLHECRDSFWRWLLPLGEFAPDPVEDDACSIPSTVPVSCEDSVSIDVHGATCPTVQFDLQCMLAQLLHDPSAASHRCMKHLPWVIAHSEGLFCLVGWSPSPLTVFQLLQRVWKHIEQNDIVLVTSNQKQRELQGGCESDGTILTVTFAKKIIRIGCPELDTVVVLNIDPCWRFTDVKGYVAAQCGLLANHISIFDGNLECDDDDIPWDHINSSLIMKKKATIDFAFSFVGKIPLPPVPPSHADKGFPNATHARFSVRHPVWSTVRTTGTKADTTLRQIMAMLLSDFDHACYRVQSDQGTVSMNTVAPDLVNTKLVVVFDGSMSLPAQDLIMSMPSRPMTMTEYKSLTQVWVRSPFCHRAKVEDVPGCWSLSYLAASQLRFTNVCQTLMVLVDGQHVDPRQLVKDVHKDAIISIRMTGLPGGAKPKHDMKSKLRSALIHHGVPDSAVDARIASIMQGIAIDKLRVHESEDADTFWGSLKKLASEERIRLVTALELRDYQKLKRNNARVVAASSRDVVAQSRKQARLPPLEDLNICTQHFCTGDDVVPVIEACRFGPDAEGIAIMAVEEAAKHSTVGCISEGPLAILAIGMRAESLGPKLMVPAHNKDGAPLLVPGTLLQHGEVSVEFRAAVPSAETTAVDAITLEFTLKRDLITQWDATATPMHFLGVQCPELRGAGKILSSWSVRSYKDRKPVPFAQADVWHGYMKLDARLVDSVLKRSGQQGLFFTPRGSDKRPDSRYAVIPFPGQSLESIKEKCCEVPHALGIAVLGSSFQTFGIRCRKEAQDQLKMHFFPESLRVDAAEVHKDDQLWTIRHLTSQFTREGMDNALTMVQWDARAIKSTGPSSWLVASSSPPPAEHLCINGSLAVVSARRVPMGAPVVVARSDAIMKVSTAADGSQSSFVARRVEQFQADIASQVNLLVDERLGQTQAQVMQLSSALDETKAQLQAAQDAANHQLEQLRLDQTNMAQKVTDMESSMNQHTGTILQQMKSMFESFHSDNSRQMEAVQNSIQGQLTGIQTEVTGRIDSIERDQSKRHKPDRGEL